MKINKLKLGVAIFCCISSLSFGQTPASINGKLKLVGTQLSSECGSPVQLRGVSSHGPQWFGSCVSKRTALNALKNEWNADIVRLAMYVEEGGYLSDPESWKAWIDAQIARIEQTGMYCLIDWHILSDGDPFKNLAASKEFWSYMSKKYAQKNFVMYEICNEPNGVTWDRIKAYADTIIPIIRANDPDKIIIVGTPQWSGSPLSIVGNELKGANAYNVMYAFHFYAGSHSWMIPNLKTAIGSIPIFCTEWGTSTSTGNGTINTQVTDMFMDVFNGNNPSGNIISWCNWSFSDADETSAALLAGSCDNATWNNTTPSGTKVKSLINTPDRFAPCDGSPFILIQPENKRTKPDSSVTFYVKTFGNGIKYKWLHSTDSLNWDDLPNTDTSFFTINAISEKDTGYYKVIVSNMMDTLESNAASLSIFYNGPFNGKPFMIPCKIEAEEYDEGNANVTNIDKTFGNSGGALRFDNVDIETTQDTAGTYNVGWISAGEFLSYSVDISESGKYDFEFRVASGSNTNGRISAYLSDSLIIPSAIVPPTGGWQTWTTIAVKEVVLPKGNYNLKWKFLTDGFNLNYVNIKPNTPLGLEELSIFPQPANESLSISSNNIDFTGKSVEIIDMLGSSILTETSSNKTIELDVKNLKKGIYLIRIQTQNSYRVLKWNKN